MRVNRNGGQYSTDLSVLLSRLSMSRVFCSRVQRLPKGPSVWAASVAQEGAPDVEAAGKFVSQYSRSQDALAPSKSGSVG